jgi:hypothetical protein
MAKTPTSKAVIRVLATRHGTALNEYDIRRIAQRPEQQKRWVGLRNPPVKLEDVVKLDYYANGEAAVALFAAENGADWPGIAEVFTPLEAHVTAAVGYMLSGKPLEEMRKTVGLCEIDLRLISACDRNGFNPLWKWVKSERAMQRRERYADIMQERIEKGVAKPVVIRTARDHDEIRMVTSHSDSLLVKANEFEREDRREAKGGTSIGTQIVYNVNLPSYLQPAKPEKVIEAV